MKLWRDYIIRVRDFFRRFLSVRVFGSYNLHDLYENVEKISILQKTGLMVEVHLADHCNLNCRGCSHFSPISDHNLLSPIAYKKDIARLAEVLPSKSVRRVRLLGGEPLLNPDVEQIITLTTRAYPGVLVELVTNGLLLSVQPNSFWETCRQESVVIVVSRYPIPIDLDGISEKAKAERVKLVIGPSGKYKSFYKWVYDVRGKQNAYLSHLFCFNNGYTCQLKDGRFYPCCAAAYYGSFAKKFNLSQPDPTKSSIDIYDNVCAVDFFRLVRHSVEMCKYCNIRSKTPNAGWGLSKKDMCEWT